MSQKNFQTLRGMRDVLPADSARWQRIESAVLATFGAHAYEEIRLPLLEDTGLFKRGVGEATDIVEKEMFSFASRDENDDGSLTLRPEGTASCVRALQQHGLLYNQTQRVWYRGPMFRYERPQKGRYRQFEQIGAEVFGIAGPAVEAELIMMTAEAFDQLGILSSVELQLNTLGSGGARQAYRAALIDYLKPFTAELDADSQRRLQTNPLRILDSKNARTQEIVQNAPQLPDFVDDEAKKHFDDLQALLTDLNIAYRLNSSLVRGLDYYTHTVFEWITTELGAQGTVCGGGRYDLLVELLGGKPTPGAGFAMGVDRLVLLHEAVHGSGPGGNTDAGLRGAVDVYLAVADSQAQSFGLQLANELRGVLPDLRLRTHISGGKLKAQMKKADASGATLALIVGAQEMATGTVTCKHLRATTQDQAQQSLPVAELAAYLAQSL